MRTLTQSLSLLSYANRVSGLVSPFATSALSHMLRIPAGSTYSGPLIRVRRSSDDAELDIGAGATADVNGNRWLNTSDILSFIGAGSAFAVRWYDCAGVRHLEQLSKPEQPRLALNGVIDIAGGVPALVFSGAQSMTAINAAQNIAQPVTMHLVASASGTPQKVTDSSLTTARLVIDVVSGNAWRMFSGFSAPAPNNTFTPNERAVISATFNGAASSLRKNGVTIVAAANAGTHAMGPLRIGKGVVTPDWLTGVIQEIVAFNSAQGAEATASITMNQGAAFGITVA